MDGSPLNVWKKTFVHQNSFATQEPIPSDILIVDRSIAPISGKIVITAINGKLRVKRLFKKGDAVRLVAENDAYHPIENS